MGDIVRAFAGAAIGALLGFVALGLLGLACGLALGAAYGLGAAPRR